MAGQGVRSLRETVEQLNAIAGEVTAAVRTLPRASGSRPAAIEQAVLRGLEASVEAQQQLIQALDSAGPTSQDIEPISEALEQVEQKLAFFHGCTMRRSSLDREDEEADEYARQAEAVAGAVSETQAIDQLVEAYKATEGLEGRVVELRGQAKSGSGPEPRVLDLPRARVLAARRLIGSRLLALDSE